MVLVTVGAGCRSVGLGTQTAQQTAAPERARAGVLSADQLEEELKEFSTRFSLHVQAAANEIAVHVTDNRMRKQTVYWKLFAIPYCREAVLRREPVAAFVDVWVLCFQMREYFSTGEGRNAFGDQTHLAAESAELIYRDISRIAAMVLSEDQIEQARQGMMEFAEEHPISGPFAREAPRPPAANANAEGNLQRVFDASLTPLRAIGGLDQTALAIQEVAAVADETNEILAHMPEHVRWNTEILLYELEEKDTVRTANQSLATFSRSAEKLVGQVDRLPGELRRELTAALEDLESRQAELRATLKATKDTAEALEKTSKSMTETSQGVAKAGKAWDGTIRTLWDMVNDFKGDPSEPPSEEGRPYDILDYARTAEETAKAAAELRAATREVHGLIRSEDIGEALTRTRSSAETLTGHVAKWCVTVIVVFFASLLGYRLLWRYVTRKDAVAVGRSPDRPTGPTAGLP